MAGYIPAPATPTRLSTDGKVFDSGDIQLTPGVGTSLSRTPGKPVLYTITGEIADASMPPTLFLPGPMAALDPAAQLAVNFQTAGKFLSLLEVNCGTAPVGANAANCHAVKVYGDGPNSQAFTLNIDGAGDNGGKHYLSNLVVGSVVGTFDNTNGGKSYRSTTARYMLFQPTQDLQVGAVAATSPFDNEGSGTSKVYEIVRWSDGAIVASTNPYYGPLDTGAAASTKWADPVPLSAPVTLKAGVVYGFGVRLPLTSFLGAIRIGGSNAPAFSGSIAMPAAPASVAYFWDGSIAGAPPSLPAGISGAGAGWSLDQRMSFQLYGGPRTALINGNARVAIVTIGTGPATSPAADLNVRMGWQVGT